MISYITPMPTSMFGRKECSYADYLRKSNSPPRKDKEKSKSPKMDFEEEPQALVENERISISVINHQGRFRRAIPCLPMWLAGLCCLFNVFIPGLGTLVAAFSVLCCSDPRGETKSSSFTTNLLAAFLQLLTSPLIVGIIWSIMWGVLFIQIAHEQAASENITKRKAKDHITYVAASTTDEAPHHV